MAIHCVFNRNRLSFPSAKASSHEPQPTPEPPIDSRPIIGVIYTIPIVRVIHAITGGSVTRGERSFAKKAYVRVVQVGAPALKW